MSDNSSPKNSPSEPPKEDSKTLEAVIREKAPSVLSSIPEPKRQELARIRIEKHESFSMRAGPLPDPSELDAYNQIIPNGADRIIKMAENQSAHRIEIETMVVKSQQRQAFAGQLFALILGLSGLGLATYAAVSGQPWFGSVIGGSTLVGLVSVFLYTRHVQRQDLGQKREQMELIQRRMNERSQNRKKKNQK